MKKVRPYHLIMLASVFIIDSSCIRDNIQPCPPLSVMIDIEDKNYDNIDIIEQETGLAYRIDENLDFKSYIQKLFYALYNLDTGETVFVKHLHDVEGTNRMATVHLPDSLPFGNYGLIVWGNILSEEGILSDGQYGTYDLHKGHVEGYDVYMSADKLIYDEYHYNYTVKLKRLKGKLIIQALNFPEDTQWSEKEITGVSGNVDFSLNYSESETVYTTREWDTAKSRQGGSDIVSHTILAPSIQTGDCKVEINLFGHNSDDEAILQLAPVKTQITRNRITVMRYNYNPDNGTTDVYILMDDGWTAVHNLEI